LVAKDNKAKLVQTAQDYANKGQYKKAIGEYEKIVKLDPTDIRSRLKLAELYIRQKRTPDAITTFVECAEVYERQGFNQKAVAVFKQAIHAAPREPELYKKLAVNYTRLGLRNDAAAQYHTAIGLYGDDTGQKLDVIRSMLELDQENVHDRVRLAEAYSRLGRRSDAVREFRRVCDMLEKLGAHKDFQRAVERLLYHAPEDAEMGKRVARAYLDREGAALALPKLKQAHRISPQDLETLGMIAEAFEQLGQVHKAVTVLKEMGRLYTASGLDRERDECLARIAELDPTDESVKKPEGPAEQSGQTIVFDPPTGPSPRRRPSTAPGLTGPDPRIVGIAQALEPVRPQSQPVQPAPDYRRAEPQAVSPPSAAQPPRERGAVGERSNNARLESAATEARPPAGKPAAPPEQAEPPKAGPAPAWSEEEEDAEGGFGFGDPVESTLVDSRIPDLVTKSLAAPAQNWQPASPPAAQAAVAAPPSPAVATPGVAAQLRDDLRELDFYIVNGLRGEAALMLDELELKYGAQPVLTARRKQVTEMR
jgi:tetratricopeptide (TPR) repeat protein